MPCSYAVLTEYCPGTYRVCGICQFKFGYFHFVVAVCVDQPAKKEEKKKRRSKTINDINDCAFHKQQPSVHIGKGAKQIHSSHTRHTIAVYKQYYVTNARKRKSTTTTTRKQEI